MLVGCAEMKEETNLCRICLKCLSTDTKHQTLKDLEENVLECLTEIDLTIPANPLACEDCLASIRSLYRFKQTCVVTERLVQDLRSRSIPFEDALKYVDIDKVKSEEEHLEVVDYSDIDFNTEIPMVLQNNNAVASNTCFTCSSTFNSRQGFLLHLKSHKEKCLKGGKKVHSELCLHKCNNCEYISNRKDILWKHTGEKPYACDLCDFRSTHKDTLACHVMVHLDRRLFNCGQCNYSSSEKRYLRKHMNTHTNERRNFKCAECDYVATRRSKLNIHMRKHTNERYFKCAECDYGAIARSKLNIHMRKHHTGDKTYKCDKCSYTTVHSGYITRHRKLHLSSPILKCDSCDFKTLNISHLLYHTC